MEKITIKLKKEEIFSLLEKNKFILSKSLLSDILKSYSEIHNQNSIIKLDKKKQNYVFNHFINIYKGIYFDKKLNFSFRDPVFSGKF